MPHFELLSGSLGVLEVLQLALEQLILLAHCLKGVKLLDMHLCTVQIPRRVALRAEFMFISTKLSSRQACKLFMLQSLSHHGRQI